VLHRLADDPKFTTKGVRRSFKKDISYELPFADFPIIESYIHPYHVIWDTGRKLSTHRHSTWSPQDKDITDHGIIAALGLDTPEYIASFSSDAHLIRDREMKIIYLLGTLEDIYKSWSIEAPSWFLKGLTSGPKSKFNKGNTSCNLTANPLPYEAGPSDGHGDEVANHRQVFFHGRGCDVGSKLQGTTYNEHNGRTTRASRIPQWKGEKRSDCLKHKSSYVRDRLQGTACSELNERTAQVSRIPQRKVGKRI
jgi:hypothetical protein